MFSLVGKVAAISGCTRGIGKSMALALAEAGAGKYIHTILYTRKLLIRNL